MNISPLRDSTKDAYRANFIDLVGGSPPVESTDLIYFPFISGERAEQVLSLTGMSESVNPQLLPQCEEDEVRQVAAVLLAHLLALAEAYMGSREKALKWLSKPMAQLDGQSAFATVLTGTEQDLDVAEQLVLRMGEGLAL